MSAKILRQQALNDTRRTLILDAARVVFELLGIEGASIRKIAEQAGYTPGAIYSYFENKEAIYGALLATSLERLNQAVASAHAPEPVPARQLRAKALAWFQFYIEHPRDLELGFYLVQGLQPRGLTADLNRELNKQLYDALHPAQLALEAMGLVPDDALRENTALFAHGMGLLILQHTGRIRMFGQNPIQLFSIYVENLVQRLEGCAPAESN